MFDARCNTYRYNNSARVLQVIQNGLRTLGYIFVISGHHTPKASLASRSIVTWTRVDNLKMKGSQCTNIRCDAIASMHAAAPAKPARAIGIVGGG